RTAPGHHVNGVAKTAGAVDFRGAFKMAAPTCAARLIAGDAGRFHAHADRIVLVVQVAGEHPRFESSFQAELSFGTRRRVSNPAGAGNGVLPVAQWRLYAR